MIKIDGATGEGGGQMLRSSLALSLLTGQPFEMVNVRARRSKPGLQPQHLMSVKAAAEISASKVRGAELRSQHLVFEPGTVRAGEYRFPIGTAGATSLILHTIYLPLALTGQESRVVIEGGTHVPHSPSFHFLDTTWRAYMAAIGLNIDLAMPRPGFYPRGGGRIEAVIHGIGRDELHPLNIEKYELSEHVEGFSAVAGLPESIAERQAGRARERLERSGFGVELRLEQWRGGPGTVIGLSVATSPAPTLFFAIGERGKRAETVAEEAVEQMVRFLNCEKPGVDPHSADQLLLPLVFCRAPSRFPAAELTQHVFTNRDVLALFLPRVIQLVGQVDEPGIVRIEVA